MVIIFYYVRDFFSFIGDVLSAVFDLIWNLIQVLIKSAEFLISVVGALPLIITGPVTVLIIVSVLYKVLGREGGQ